TALLTDAPGAGAECHPGKEREGFRSAKRGHAPHGPGGGENYSPKVDLIKRSFTLATCSRARRSANSALRLRIASKIAQCSASASCGRPSIAAERCLSSRVILTSPCSASISCLWWLAASNRS